MFGNIGDMMKQAKKMQAMMAEVDKALTLVEVDGAAGGGLVTATVDGKGSVKRVKIDPSLLDPGEVEVLEDLLAAALHDAQTKAEAKSTEEMGKVTGGLKLPGGMKF